MRKTLNVLLTALFIVSIFVLIITFSIGLPIYCRFFYYLQINPLNIPEITGYDYAQIKFAYDQVLNYLTLPNAAFGTGVFKHSADGAAHFADCKVLFNLNDILLLCSLILSTVTIILDKKGIIKLYRPFGFSPAFYSAALIFIVIAILAAIVSVDFNAAFTVFHHLFFPGKDNWTFNAYYDEIILALPQQFFLNCAILIALSIFIITLSIIIINLVKKAKNNKK